MKTVYVVIYSTSGMRERHFDNEQEANEFALTVAGSVVPMQQKVIPYRTSAQSRKYNNELRRIKKFGYGT